MEIKKTNTLSGQWLKDTLALDEAIFDQKFSLEKIQKELIGRPYTLGVFAYEDKKPIGFKVGFELYPYTFYSWIGGVLEESRGKGVARSLMEAQHEYLKEDGYRWVRTQSQNRFKKMMICNLRFGFNIKGIEVGRKDPEPYIIFEKKLS